MCIISKASSHLLILIIIYSFFILLNTQVSIGADTISPGTSLSGNQTIISSGGNFELGFFSPGTTHNYYIAIWYKKISVQTVIWIANREIAVSNTSSSELKISKDGSLVLESSKTQIWSSNSTSSASASTVAVLLDTGNLVLREQLKNSSAILWQSFDHPTDTVVPEGWLGMNKITGDYQRLTSWKSHDEPAPGLFTGSIDPGGIDQFVLLWNGTKVYYRTGAWNGRIFSLIPGMSATSPFEYKFVDDAERRYFTVTLSNNYTLARGVMDSSGQTKQYIWMNDTEAWLMAWAEPFAPCDVYSACGAFGICDQTISALCSCPLGFEPTSKSEWESEDWSSGCVRKIKLECDNKNTSRGHDRFLAMPNMHLPADARRVIVQNDEECELTCLNDCSCVAYSYAGGCLVWDGAPRTLQQLSDGNIEAKTLHLRLSSYELPITSKNKKIVRYIIVGVGVAVAIFLFSFVCLICIFRKRKQLGKLITTGGSLISFKYRELQSVTKNFSEELGRGGFGPVFKGILQNSTVVAVKKLANLGQGEKQFRNEVRTLGNIQHVNLVRLRGFCCEGSKRLLVYDYMPNGSLDHHLFRNNSNILDWETRYRIILGIARGLAYLHEECRECIIHCDIKPENILLDAEICPKVSDFGMAKLVGHDFSRVLTTMRGTIGYLSPEWIAGLPITAKADVYSFGMMLFEVISGRRNTAQSEDGSKGFFPIWVATRVHAGEVDLNLLDKNLEGDADMKELEIACKVACWCIQDNEAERPSMGQVVQIMEGVLEVNMPPIPRALQLLTEDADVA